MQAFQIGAIHLNDTGNGWHLVIPVSAAGRSVEVEYQFPPALGRPVVGDAILCLFLMPAMKLGLPLRGVPPVSPRLAASVPRLQEIITAWFPGFHVIDPGLTVAGPARQGSLSGSMSFFSAGLDSWHTIMLKKQVLSHVVYVHGYDLPNMSDERHDRVGERLRNAAPVHGVPFHEIRTNYREFGEDFLGEYIQTHGAALAAIGHFLSDTIGHLHTPSTADYLDQAPWGSSYLLDPLWSGDNLTVHYEGAEWSRAEKAMVGVEYPGILDHVIVCQSGYLDGENCGRCEKCLRTMCGFHLAGVGDISGSFKTPLSLEAFAALRIQSPLALGFWEDLQATARRVAPGSPWDAAITRIVSEYHLHRAFKDLKSRKVSRLPDPVAAELAPLRNPIWTNLQDTEPGWLRKRVRQWTKSNMSRAKEALWK